MDRSLKLLFFFCFVVFFFSGCAKSNRSEKVNGPGKGGAGAPTAEQEKIKAQNQELVEVERLLKSADRLFTQTWATLVKTVAGQTPEAEKGNVFRAAHHVIGEFLKMEKEKEAKVAVKTQKVQEKGATAPASDTEERLITPVVLRAEKTKKDAKDPQKELKYVELKIGYRKKGDDPKADFVHIADIQKYSTGFNILWYPENLGGSQGGADFDGLGRAVTYLDSSHRPLCRYLTPSKPGGGTLHLLNCANLGQNIDQNKVLLLDTMELDRRKSTSTCDQGYVVTGRVMDPTVAELAQREKKFAGKDLCANEKILFKIEEIDSGHEDSEAAPIPEPGLTGATPSVDPGQQPTGNDSTGVGKETATTGAGKATDKGTNGKDAGSSGQNTNSGTEGSQDSQHRTGTGSQDDADKENTNSGQTADDTSRAPTGESQKRSGVRGEEPGAEKAKDGAENQGDDTIPPEAVT